MFLKKDVEVEFLAIEGFDLLSHQPRPSKYFIPEWYKKMDQYIQGETKPLLSRCGELVSTSTLKRCVPIQDVLTTGYTIPLYADIVTFHTKGEELQFNWGNLGNWSVIEKHTILQLKDTPFENECYGGKLFKFLNPWRIKTPKGYSCLFIPPFYHSSSFQILPGVVDTDVYHEVNFPFVYTGPEGDFTHKAGSPLVTVIPFKRETFSHKVNKWTKSLQQSQRMQMGATLVDFYRNFCHKKKLYK